MNLWKYYNNKSNQLKYPNIFVHTHEKEIAKTNPKWAFEYVLKHGKDEDLEPIIAKSVYHSFWYAKLILNGPFKLGEKAIATDAQYSFFYALNIIKRKFELGESTIAKNEYRSSRYAHEVLKQDFYLNGILISSLF